MITVYVTIGNSDDKLSQAEWSAFVNEVGAVIRLCHVVQHGFWLSPSDARWQNACWCFELRADPDPVKERLADLGQKFRQDSIAWAEAPEVEFLGSPR